MRCSSQIESEDVDFGTVYIDVGLQDDLSVTYSDGVVTIALPLYNRQAAELIEVLQPIAELEDLT